MRLSAAVVALGAALAAWPAAADQSYPPGLFENSPVVPPGQPTGEPAPAPSGPDGPSADAAPQDYDAPPAPGYGGPPPPDYVGPPAPAYGGPVAPGSGGPPGPHAPPSDRPEAYAPQTDYCAGIANRVFGSLEELRRAHARCDHVRYAPPPPPGYPPAY